MVLVAIIVIIVVFGAFSVAPVHAARDELFLLVDLLLAFNFLEGLNLLTVLDVDRTAATALVSDKELAVALVHANAGDV